MSDGPSDGSGGDGTGGDGRPDPDQRHLLADVPPLDVDGVRTVVVCEALWLIAFVALLPFWHRLHDDHRLWLLWMCAAGFGLGLIGLAYCLRRRSRLAADG